MENIVISRNISKIITEASEQAHQYASAYTCNSATLRSAIEAQHFVMLVNDAISEIKQQINAHCKEIWSIK